MKDGGDHDDDPSLEKKQDLPSAHQQLEGSMSQLVVSQIRYRQLDFFLRKKQIYFTFLETGRRRESFRNIDLY